MKKSIKKTLSLLLCTAMIMTMMLSQAALAATDYTCYIGSNGYSTLAEAVEAANAGDTIWMTANDSVSTTFDVDKNLTIELEGYTLANACMRFVGDITVNINDRAGTAKINTNQNSGFKVTDYEYDSRVRAAFYLTGGAKVILSGTTGGTEIYGGAQCTDGLTILEKAAVVGKGCELVINGGSLVYSGYTGTDGVFVCDTGILTLKDILIRRSSSNTGGSSISYANVPTIENPLTITKGHFYGGMWVEGSSTINGVYISRGTLSFDKIEKALLYNSVGSYIDYDKSTNSNGWEIFVASENLSTDTDIDNVVDSTETLRVSAGGNVSADAGQKVVFQPQVTGGDGMSEITYAWTKDGADTGVTTDAFVIEATTSADAGEYVFTATQGSNSVSCTYVLSVQAENHSHHDISFDKWSEMTDLPTLSGNYYLENEVTLSAIWTVPQGVTNLCINGRVIDLNSYYINVPAGAALNIYTCEDLKQYYDVSDNLWIPVGGFTDENKERYTSGGVITGGSNSAIFVNGGSLTLNGGAIAGNTGNAGGVTLMNGATFTMNGGDIVGNSSKGDAGGVMNNNSTFTMNGGRIHNNYAANNGGGVFNVYENALFTMNGGKIYDNISSVGAGGIGNYEDAEMIVTGGSICGNSTTWGGGGIFNYHSTLTLMGGVIDNNSSTWGGGAVLNEGILHISGAPVIKDNFVNETPNNIYLLYPEFPIVVDGPISSGPIPVSVYPDEGQLDDDFKFTNSADVSLNDASDFEYEYEGYHIEKKDDGQLYVVADSTEVESKLFSTDVTKSLLSKAVSGGLITKIDNIRGVAFVDLNDYQLDEITTVDYSADGDGSVLAWFDEDNAILYIGGYGKIIAGNSLAYAFYNGHYVDSIVGFEYLDVSNVTNMSRMFSSCGYSSTTFTLDLGDNFDTRNVTNMEKMFFYCGENSTAFTLDLGNSFDTSNVTDMNGMFESCGYRSKVFALDLGESFDTSNVTSMVTMFCHCGRYSTTFTLDLGKSFNTSNVTNMRSMFANCGRNSTTFTLDLGDGFDTSNVTNMSHMFANCGSESEAFDLLDLSGFTVSPNVKYFDNFAHGVPVTTFVFGDGWNDAALSQGMFGAVSETPTTIVNATENLLVYDWAADNRVVTYEGTQPEKEPKYEVENGGTIDIVENEDGTVTLYVSVPDGFSFVGWHDGTKIISTDNPYTFVPEAGKTYTAKLEEIQPDPVNKYTITANATDGGVAEGTATVEEGQSITLTATANEGYEFIGWFDGDTKVCETEEFTVENVTSDKTYTAKFELLKTEEPDEPDEPDEPEYPELPDTPSSFDFDSIRTANGKNIVVDHENRIITVDVKEGDDNLVLYVHQKDIIPGGQIRMRSYLGNKVTYDESGIYRIYSINSTPICVMAKIIIDGVIEDYLIVSNYNGIVPDGSFDFDTIRTENGENIVVDHENRIITVDVKEGDDNLVLYVHQTWANPGAQIRMKSYNGNKVTYDDSGIYRIYCVNDTSVTVTAKVIADGESREYDLVANYSGIQKNGGFDFTTIRTANGENISVNHETQTITVDVKEGDDNLILYVHQKEANPGAQIRMKSYNGNKVVYEDSGIYRIYTIGGTPITVSANIIVNGETKQYDIIANFTTDLPKFNFNSLSCANAESISVDHESRTITIDAKVNAEELIIYKKQYASLGGTLKMSSYMGNRVIADNENGSYAVCHVKNDSVSVKANITINGETREYLITVNYNIDPWQFDTIDIENGNSISVNHSDKTITVDMTDGCNSTVLAIDQVFVGTNAQIWMKSYNGNKVQYNAESRNYTITRISADSITVSVKITIKGETRYYDLILNF